MPLLNIAHYPLETVRCIHCLIFSTTVPLQCLRSSRFELTQQRYPLDLCSEAQSERKGERCKSVMLQ